MIRRKALLIMALMAGYVLLAPASALADGPVDPVATNYVARVGHTPPGVRAKVIDGYLQLWMSVRAGETVIVRDQLGAGWLRFSPHGVYENHHSLLYYVSQTPVEAIPPKHINAATPPDWVKISSGHSARWRDGRLQAFAYQARLPGQSYVGQWGIALTVNGRAARLSGGVYYEPHPSVVWFWPIAVILLSVLAAWRLGSARVDRTVVTALTPVLLAAMAVLALARLLHGRPELTWFQVLECVVALAALGWTALAFARGRFPAALPFVIALVALWAGLTFLPVLTHANVVLILPGWLSRCATVALLGGGLSLGLMAMRRPLVDRSA